MTFLHYQQQKNENLITAKIIVIYGQIEDIWITEI